MNGFSAFVALALITVPAIARADVVSGEVFCPPGALLLVSHEGPRCIPSECHPVHGCELPSGIGRMGYARPSGECMPWRVCTREVTIEPDGFRGANEPWNETLVVSTCPADGDCDGTEPRPPTVVGTFIDDAATCRVARFCVDLPEELDPFPGAAVESAPSVGCACRAGPVGRSTGTCTLLIPLLFWWRRR